MSATKRLFSDHSGLAILALALLLTIINSMLFVRSAGLLISPIAREGLVVNVMAATVAWIVLFKGKRKGVLQQVVAAILLALIHYFPIVNIWSFVACGL